MAASNIKGSNPRKVKTNTLTNKEIADFMVAEFYRFETAGFWLRLRWLFTGVKVSFRKQLPNPKRAQKEQGR